MMDNRYGIEVASDPTTPVDTLRRFASGATRHGDKALHKAVLANPNCPSDVLIDGFVRGETCVLDNPAFALALLVGDLAPESREQVARLVKHLTLSIIASVIKGIWCEQARLWLAHVALPRAEGQEQSQAETKRWARNIKTLIKGKSGWPSRINSEALIDNALRGHPNPTGAILVLARRLQPLRRASVVEQHALLDRQLDAADMLLGAPRAPEVYPGVWAAALGRVPSLFWVSDRATGLLPGMEAA